MDSFLQGTIAAGFAVAGLFFLRYWKETRDRLFLLFALSFFTSAVNRAMLVAVATAQGEHAHYFYLVRLASFLLIIVAIVDKNVRRSSDPGSIAGGYATSRPGVGGDDEQLQRGVGSRTQGGGSPRSRQ